MVVMHIVSRCVIYWWLLGDSDIDRHGYTWSVGVFLALFWEVGFDCQCVKFNSPSTFRLICW